MTSTFSLAWKLSPCTSEKRLLMLLPGIHDSTRTWSVENATLGNRTELSPAKLASNWMRLYASQFRSSCLIMALPKVDSSKGIAMLKNVRPTVFSIEKMIWISVKVVSMTRGCKTLTATLSNSLSPATMPSFSLVSAFSFALWTCATLPLATGSFSNSSKISVRLSHWNASLTAASVSSQPCAGAFVLSLPRAWIRSGGHTSGLMLSHCPIF
mmetsp:Transcript_53650/g.131120  ORF Transcript_53650/g.131120 Transcript_53650/m.131120 type:complete len:212 (+) Transcript_53650:3394-4029(+)